MVLLSFDCNNLLVKRTDGDRYDVRLPSGLLSVSFVSLEPSPLSSLIYIKMGGAPQLGGMNI